MAHVTALRAAGTRVAVELDGKPWRTVPLEAVVAAGLAAGVELDRERVRLLAKAVRRARAERVAVQALSRREHSRTTLGARLARAGVAPEERDGVVACAADAGLVDDARFAALRSRHLAERGAGDLLVLDDLERHGVDEARAHAAVSALEPESVRAARIVGERGWSARTVRYLAARGFTEDTLEPLVAELSERALR